MDNTGVQGSIELRDRLRRLIKGLPNVVAAALYKEAEIEMRKAKTRCPKKTGALRASGTVHYPEVHSKEISVQLTFGVPTPYYAIYVHENLDPNIKYTTPGTGPKFLERTLQESASDMGRRLADRIKLDRWGI